MSGSPKQAIAHFRVRRALHVGAAMIFAILAGIGGTRALPIAATMHAAAARPGTMLAPVRSGDCVRSCPECSDCVPEIDIAPPRPYREREDPIGHAIKRLEPSPLLAPDDCPETEVEELRGTPSGCGIRCWYWRLRQGYCGPGCDYYSYRLGHRATVSAPPAFAPARPRHNCRS